MSLKSDAVRYVEMGLAVFPLMPRDKIPRISGGFTNATNDDPEGVSQYWDMYPDSNIGIAMGQASGGVFVLDFDTHGGVDGTESLADWEMENGALPETVSATTGGGGYHLFFRSSQTVNCSTNSELGIDVRGNGGYIVAPPSVHPNGNQYCWENDPSDFAIAEADERVMEFLEYAQGRKKSRRFVLPERIGSGSRNDTLYRYACSLQAKGTPDDTIYDAIMGANMSRCDRPLPKSECMAIVEQALRRDKGEDRSLARMNEASAVNKADVVRALDMTGKGSIKQTIRNCMQVVMLDQNLAGKWWYDEMSYQRKVDLPLPWDNGNGTRAVRDEDYLMLSAYLEHEYELIGSSRATSAAVAVCRTNLRNPLTEWLESLVWDGEERMDMLFSATLGADVGDYEVEVARVFLFGAIERAFHPGCKFDYTLMLYGPQGCGKSTLMRLLAHRPEWYCSLDTVEGDAAVEKLRGMWIIEMAEMLASKRQRDVEATKAFLTNQVDNIRPKYGRETEQRPRTCVISGTTNSHDVLTDNTGNRRFLPVECMRNEPWVDIFGDEESVSAYIEQVWAEAMERRRRGQSHTVLPRSVAAAAERKQESFTREDPRIGIIQEWLDGRAGDCLGDLDRLSNVRVCAIEICDKALGWGDRNPPKALVSEVRAIMDHKVEGWRQYGSSNGKARTGEYGIQRCYVPDASYYAGLYEWEESR